MSYDYNAPVTVTYPRSGRVLFAFQTPSGNPCNLEVDKDSPDIAPLLKRDFVFACLVDQGNVYDFIGFKGSDDELPYRNNDDLII
ncbi:MAG: hypothetical protein AB8B83_01780 [Bdellovibrionales bacterium]